MEFELTQIILKELKERQRQAMTNQLIAYQFEQESITPAKERVIKADHYGYIQTFKLYDEMKANNNEGNYQEQ